MIQIFFTLKCGHISAQMLAQMFSAGPFAENFSSQILPQNKIHQMCYQSVHLLNVCRIADPLNFALTGYRTQTPGLSAGVCALAPALGSKAPASPGLSLLTRFSSSSAFLEANHCVFFFAEFVFNSDTFLTLQLCGASVPAWFHQQEHT